MLSEKATRHARRLFKMVKEGKNCRRVLQTFLNRAIKDDRKIGKFCKKKDTRLLPVYKTRTKFDKV